MDLSPYTPYLDWIDQECEKMVELIIDWAETPSHSFDTDGLEIMLAALERDFSVLGGEVETLPVSPIQWMDGKGASEKYELGKVLSIKKRPEAKRQVLLVGHMDTVFASEMGFLHCDRPDAKTLMGPGVIDMKGGLCVMLKAVEAFERSPFSQNVGWEILINADEEIGSPGSGPILEERAGKFQVGLIFEPPFPNGEIVTCRKGSSTFTLKIEGTSAHAGRDFFSGKSAVAALAEILTNLHELNHPEKGITLNLGYIYGGGPVNIVPDLAICKLNIRTFTEQDLKETTERLYELTEEQSKKHGVKYSLEKVIERPPKPLTPELEALFQDFQRIAGALNIELLSVASGGVCDGNILAGAGLTNLDTLGPIGGKMHTKEEFLIIDSLSERTKLAALYLMQLGRDHE